MGGGLTGDLGPSSGDFRELAMGRAEMSRGIQEISGVQRGPTLAILWSLGIIALLLAFPWTPWKSLKLASEKPCCFALSRAQGSTSELTHREAGNV